MTESPVTQAVFYSLSILVGKAVSEASSVPEPSALILLGTVLIILRLTIARSLGPGNTFSEPN